MRPLPSSTEYGSWDELPDGPAADELDTSNPDVKDALARRDLLTEQWHAYRTYPLGTWREEAIRHAPDQAEAWRNWFLRRSWEGINQINGSLRRWSLAELPGSVTLRHPSHSTPSRSAGLGSVSRTATSRSGKGAECSHPRR